MPASVLSSFAPRVPLRRSAFCLLMFAGLAVVSSGAIERTIERSFIAAPGCIFKIDTGQGAIRVEPSADNQFHLLVRESMTAENEADADRLLQGLDLKIEETAAQVSVRARYRRATHWIWENWPPVGLAYVIKAPAGAHLDLSTAEGDITVGSLQVVLVAYTEAGAIFAGEIGGSVQATSGRGDVTATACTGELTLVAKSGNVLVGRAGGVTTIRGGSGTIEVQNSRGNLLVEGKGADLKIGFMHPLTESADLKTAGGDIDVAFDLRSACTISAKSSTFGAVKSRNLPLKIEAGKIGSSRVLATLNGGGPKIAVDSSGGSVSLTGREP